MYKFICSECKTHYSSSDSNPPPGIRWSDGHVCSPVPLKDISDIKAKVHKLEELINKSFKRL